MLSPFNTWLGDHLRVGVSVHYVTKPIRSTQLAVVKAGGNVISAGSQVALCMNSYRHWYC